ncbi:MAG: hypothetical protein ACK4P1_02430 [Aggregatilineales bacterium]
MKLLRYAILFVLSVVLAAPLVQVQAVIINGTPKITCTGVDGSGVTVTINRDNTGSNKEEVRLVAFDGAGMQIYDAGGSFSLATYPFGSGSWSPPPQYNPITLTYISFAGNGFEEQRITWTGECPGLPTFFGGPGLPANKNLVLFLSDVPILSDANGSPTGLVMKACKTAFVIGERNGFARLFMMGGWVPVSSYVDVPEEYGQKGFPVVPQCVGK